LQWMQQFTGINVLLSFGPSMFKSARIPFSPLETQVIVTIFNLIATILMMSVVDRFGRRPLLLFGAAFMLIFMVAAGIIAFLIEEYKMHNYTSLALLACLCGYMVSFGIGWGGVCWIYPSEIFPMNVKEKALSTSVGSQWLANFVTAYVVPQQVEYTKLFGTFFFYSCCLAITYGIVYCWVPETKGMPMEDMDELFGARTTSLSYCSASYVDGTGSEDGRYQQDTMSSVSHWSIIN